MEEPSLWQKIKNAAVGTFSRVADATRDGVAQVTGTQTVAPTTGGGLAKMLGAPCERKGYTCTGARQFKATRRRKKKGTRRR